MKAFALAPQGAIGDDLIDGVRTISNMVATQIKELHVTMPRWSRGCGGADQADDGGPTG